MQPYDLNHTNYERVRDLIRNDIASGTYPPGHRLKLAELVQRYGVSAAPVRDALQQLQGEGFIDFQPNRGASVRRIDRDFLQQVYDIRAAVETFFVRRLVDELGAEALASLRSTLDQHKRSLALGDEGAVHALDRQFHNLLIAADKNVEAAAILGRHYAMIRPLRVRFGRTKSRRRQLPGEHLEILQAVEARDADAAASLCLSHIYRSFEDLARLVNASAADHAERPSLRA